ncbi:MAG: hypothetical protein J0L50_14750 [Sphingomonadales bacterium]|nr:hypothetical protein [Sphingomonadales bacterium]
MPEAVRGGQERDGPPSLPKRLAINAAKNTPTAAKWTQSGIAMPSRIPTSAATRISQADRAMKISIFRLRFILQDQKNSKMIVDEESHQVPQYLCFIIDDFGREF